MRHRSHTRACSQVRSVHEELCKSQSNLLCMERGIQRRRVVRDWEKGWPHALSCSIYMAGQHCLTPFYRRNPLYPTGGTGDDTSGFGGKWGILRCGAVRRHSVPVGLSSAHSGIHQTTRTVWFPCKQTLHRYHILWFNIFFHAIKKRHTQGQCAGCYSHFFLLILVHFSFFFSLNSQHEGAWLWLQLPSRVVTVSYRFTRLLTHH